MREVYTEIRIQAPLSKVWSIVTDLEMYRDWNPFIVESHGTASLGEQLTCRPRVSKNRIATFHPKVTQLVPEQVFAWTGHVLMPGLADGVHIFEFKSPDPDQVLMIHRQEYSGILVPFLWKRIEKVATRGFTLMNEAVKKRAEESGA
ncbi:MAG: SRPBCC domain-containing protein [Proteobacteria bacterium]|nr:SRPBCC domain-containing protein [Pseudomonadota bacterium]